MVACFETVFAVDFNSDCLGLPPTLAQSLNDADLNALKKKGFELFYAGKFADALSLAKRYAEVVEARYGPENSEYATALYYIAELLRASNRFTEAERFCSQALAIDEKISGPYDPKVARDLITAASLLQATSRFSEAEPLIHRALDIDKRNLGADFPDLARDLNNLALLLQATNRVDEAERLLRHALALDERNRGEGHPEVARDLNNLAALFVDTYRFDEAEPLYRRALAINEKTFGPENTAVAMNLSNLAVAVQKTNRFSEAELLLRRSLAIDEKVLGPTHPDVAIRLNNLANLLTNSSRVDEAEPLLRRALQINEANSGPNHIEVAKNLENLATLLQKMDRIAEAEPLMLRALAIKEERLGDDHPLVAEELGNLANLNEERGHWAEAVTLFVRAKPIMTASHRSWGAGHGDVGKSVLTHYSGVFRDYARALFRSDASAAGNLAEGFELAQWALQNEAASALTSMALRFGKGEQRLAKLVRKQQDLLANHEAAFRALDAAVSRADTAASEATRATLTEIEVKLGEALERLRKDFPDYAELADPKPLPIRRRKHCSVRAKLSCCFSICGGWVEFQRRPSYSPLPKMRRVGQAFILEPASFRGVLRLYAAASMEPIGALESKVGRLARCCLASKPQKMSCRPSMPPLRMRCIAICSAGSRISSRTSRSSSFRRAR